MSEVRLDKILTDREYDVLALDAIGHSMKVIADMLGISPRTVKNHLNNIYNKLPIPDCCQRGSYASLLYVEQHPFDFIGCYAIEAMTLKETRVLELASKGYANKYIADELGVKERVVKFHLTDIYDKISMPGDLNPRRIAVVLYRAGAMQTEARR